MFVQVERLVAKLEQLRSDANAAEERAAAVSEEAKELAHALEERRGQLDSRAQNLVMARNKVDKLAQVRTRVQTGCLVVSYQTLPAASQ